MIVTIAHGQLFGYSRIYGIHMGAVWLGRAALGASEEVPTHRGSVTRRAELLPVAMLRQHVS